MNTRTTAVLLALCALFMAVIVLVERPYRRSLALRPDVQVFSGFKPSEITSIQLRPAGQFDIRLERTNRSWVLTQPLQYPAAGARVEALLNALQQLTWAAHISANELRNRPNAQAEFGFSSPQLSLIIEENDYRRHLLIGKPTALGGQVYVQVVGGDGFFVVDSEILKYLPRSANEFRDTAFIARDLAVADFLKVRSGAKGFDLQLNPTNRLWNLTWPLPARADNAKIKQLLEKLRDLRVVQFVSDRPDLDLERYGLQNPELELGFFQGTNQLLGIQLGSSPTNAATQAYVRRLSEPSIFLVVKEALDPWRALYTDFRERRLVTIPPEGVDSLQVRGQESFDLARNASGIWQLHGATNAPADNDLVRDFFLTLTRVETEVEKTVVTDFSAYGLAQPLFKYALSNAATGTLLAQIEFGTNQGRVFTRRADETFVTSIKSRDFQRLLRFPWQLRSRRVWSFDSSNVVSVLVNQKGQTRKLIRNKEGDWSFAPGSQGIINPFSLEETLHRLGELTAVFWVARGDQAADPFGFREVDHQITLEVVTDGQARTLSLSFGKPSESENPYARGIIDGEAWVFEFPWPLYYDPVRRDLTVPPRRTEPSTK